MDLAGNLVQELAECLSVQVGALGRPTHGLLLAPVPTCSSNLRWQQTRPAGQPAQPNPRPSALPSLPFYPCTHDPLIVSAPPQELQAAADFPADFASFSAVLKQVEEGNALRLRMAADVADASGTAKALVVRAEDARLCGDTGGMRRFYRQLRDVNR
jgi:hypothetical protein